MTASVQDDATLARGLREGSAAAWTSLYDAHATQVWSCVARLIGPCSATVADVVQETMLAAARSAKTYDASLGSIASWLRGIAHRQVALHYRKRARIDRGHHAMAERWLEEAPADPLEAKEAAAHVREVLADLPDDYGSLLAAKYFDGDTLEAIAQRERSTTEAVKSKLARAREAFRAAYATDGART